MTEEALLSFYKDGVSDSVLFENNDASVITTWFDSTEVTVDNELWWIKPPFIFAEINQGKSGEYTVHYPDLSKTERQALRTYFSQNEQNEALIIENILEELEQTVADEMNGDADIRKLIPYVLKEASPYGELYPFVADDNVMKISVQPGQNVVIDYTTNKGREIITDTPTSIHTSENDFNRIWSKLREYTTESVDGLRKGTIKNEVGVHLVNKQHRTIQLDCYDAHRMSLFELVADNVITINTAAFLWLVITNDKNVLLSDQTSSEKPSVFLSLLDCVVDTPTITIGDPPSLLDDRPYRTYLSRRTLDSDTSLDDIFLSMAPPHIAVQNINTNSEITAVCQHMDKGRPALVSLQNTTTIDEMIQTLSNPPLSINENQIPYFDIIIQLNENNSKNSSVAEITRQDEGFRISELFHRDAQRDEFVQDIEDSSVLEQIRGDKGWRHTELTRQLNERRKIIEVCVSLGLTKSSEVQKIIKAYESQQQRDLYEAIDARDETQIRNVIARID